MAIIVGVKGLRSTFSARDQPNNEIMGGGGQLGPLYHGLHVLHLSLVGGCVGVGGCVFVCDLQAAQSGGHKTLLYGHAILLRHSFSSMVRLTQAPQTLPS